MCVRVCVLAEDLLSFSTANLFAFVSRLPNFQAVFRRLPDRDGWSAASFSDCLATVSAPSASWGLLWCLLADALQRYRDVLLD